MQREEGKRWTISREKSRQREQSKNKHVSNNDCALSAAHAILHFLFLDCILERENRKGSEAAEERKRAHWQKKKTKKEKNVKERRGEQDCDRDNEDAKRS